MKEKVIEWSSRTSREEQRVVGREMGKEERAMGKEERKGWEWDMWVRR